MFKRITHTFIHVLDQDEALDFYVGKLGMVVHNDADLGTMRFLTVTLPEQPDLQLVLMLPGPPAYDDATAAQIRELVAKGGAGGGVIFQTDGPSGFERSRPTRVRTLVSTPRRGGLASLAPPSITQRGKR
ncbi:MAG TPA: VOC family protein [Solirubrobacteraceae bacterium]|nr:VOC family protein [Solirubrobacteraceae bacterium]